MSMKHTPGPWSAMPSDNGIWAFCDANGRHFANYRRVREGDDYPDMVLMNLAPELLSALVTASDALEQMARDHALHPYAKHCLDIVANAREAIAKAKGEQP